MNRLKKFMLNFLSQIPEMIFTKKHLYYKINIANKDLEFVNVNCNEYNFNKRFLELRNENFIQKIPKSYAYKINESRFTDDFFILLSHNQRNQLKNLHEATSQWGLSKTKHYYEKRIND